MNQVHSLAVLNVVNNDLLAGSTSPDSDSKAKVTKQKDFEGKVVIVTGSSSGIGEAVALEFAQRGAKVTLCGRDKQRLKDVFQKCQQVGGQGSVVKYMTVRGDANDAKVRESIVQETVSKFGRLDILVCCHGTVPAILPFEEDIEETYDTMMNTNLKSAYFLIQKAVPHLEKSKGCVVNVSSISSSVPSDTGLAYALAKAAMDHMTRCLALALAPKGIRVNAINPTLVTSRLAREAGFNDEAFKAFAATHPLEGRSSTPEEQASTVAFLAGQGATFITGQCVKVDGGWTLRGAS